MEVSSFSLDVDISASLDEELGNFEMVVDHGFKERSPAMRVDSVDISALVDQDLDGLEVPLLSSKDEGCVAVWCLFVWRASEVEEDAQDLDSGVIDSVADGKLPADDSRVRLFSSEVVDVVSQGVCRRVAVD